MSTQTRRRRPEGERRSAPTVPGQSVYTAAVNTQEEPHVKGELCAWADAFGVSMSVIVREALRAGIEAMRPAWQERANGTLDVDFLVEHVLRVGDPVATPELRELIADLARDRRPVAE